MKKGPWIKKGPRENIENKWAPHLNTSQMFLVLFFSVSFGWDLPSVNKTITLRTPCLSPFSLVNSSKSAFSNAKSRRVGFVSLSIFSSIRFVREFFSKNFGSSKRLWITLLSPNVSRAMWALSFDISNCCTRFFKTVFNSLMFFCLILWVVSTTKPRSSLQLETEKTKRKNG